MFLRQLVGAAEVVDRAVDVPHAVERPPPAEAAPRGIGLLQRAREVCRRQVVPLLVEGAFPRREVVGRRGLPGSPGGTVRPTCRSGGLASAFRNAASTC